MNYANALVPTGALAVTGPSMMGTSWTVVTALAMVAAGAAILSLTRRSKVKP